MGLGRIVQMLKTSKEFDFVYKNSYKFRTEMLDICVLRANLASEFFAKFRRLPCNLVGFSVSKKVGNAVSRNLVKRRLRAICRDFFSQRNSSLRAQFIARGNPPCEKFAESSLDSANPQNLVKKPCHSERSEESKKNNLVILSEAKYLKDENRDSSVATLPQNDKNSVRVAESSLDSADLQNLQGGLPRRFCESARNDEILDSSLHLRFAQNDKFVDCHDFANAKSRNDGVRRNLICIFIAKSQILQTPFATLKGIIFDALKKQVNFRQDLHKKPRTSRHNAQNRANQNRVFQNPNYNPNKGAL